MLIEPLFTGARARCRKHSNVVLGIDEEMCLDCRIIERNLSMRPPFDVLCTNTWWGFNKDEDYTVFWVIRDGKKEYDNKLCGYVFKDKWGHLAEHVYDVKDFIPHLYLTDDKKDEWRVGPEQEWVQEVDEPKDREFQEVADEVTAIINEQGIQHAA